jgi:hypothetical protein
MDGRFLSKVKSQCSLFYTDAAWNHQNSFDLSKGDRKNKLAEEKKLLLKLSKHHRFWI